MRNYVVETIRRDGFTIKTYQDTDASNPFKDWDQLTKFCQFTDDYSSRDSQPDASDLVDVEQLPARDYYDLDQRLETYGTARENVAIALKYMQRDDPAGVYIPARITCYREWEFELDADPEDANAIAFISGAAVRENFMVQRVSKKTHAHAVEMLRAEMRTFQEWLDGEVYGYVVTDTAGNDLGSCWGFFGTDRDYMIETAEEEARAEMSRIGRLGRPWGVAA